jgi:hypothetical protein
MFSQYTGDAEKQSISDGFVSPGTLQQHQQPPAAQGTEHEYCDRTTRNRGSR